MNFKPSIEIRSSKDLSNKEAYKQLKKFVEFNAEQNMADPNSNEEITEKLSKIVAELKALKSFDENDAQLASSKKRKAAELDILTPTKTKDAGKKSEKKSDKKKKRKKTSD